MKPKKQSKNKTDLQSAMQTLKQQLPQSEQIEVVQNILANLPAEELPSPTTSLINRIVVAFRRQQTRSTNRPLHTAQLQFDSWSQPAPFGVRGGTSRERQLLFNQNQFDLDLQIIQERETEAFVLRGQLLDAGNMTNLEGIELHLTEPDGHQSRRLTDEYGRFSFSHCRPGDYKLHVILEEQDIVLEPLTV